MDPTGGRVNGGGSKEPSSGRGEMHESSKGPQFEFESKLEFDFETKAEFNFETGTCEGDGMDISDIDIL